MFKYLPKLKFVRAVKILFLVIASFGFFIFAQHALANTSPYRSAATITTDGSPAYTNLSNCSLTDGVTCDRAQTPSSFANLYFKDFPDFGIPDGSTITNVKIRVTGKANIGPYVAVSPGRAYTSNCQFPSDFWTAYILNSATISTYNVTTPLTVGSLATCLSLANIKSNNFIFKINYSGPQNWYANIDNFEIAFDYTTAPTPTPSPIPTLTPTPTPTPTPAGPAPFLDLPWDYQGSFADIILNPSAWFDHHYPFENVPCCTQIILRYDGEEKSLFYRSHNGYDYGIQAGVTLGTEVLAAASGTATFKPESKSGGAGNVIKIDHGNGYQTWYEHLDPNGLIINNEGQQIHVNRGKVIGRVGLTGNTTGAHIHLSVFKDSNNNGSFDDDYPYGVVDPLGWEGDYVDPWEIWTDGIRTGNKSYYLWLKQIDGMSTTVAASSGGTFSAGKYTVSLPEHSFNPISATLDMQAEATEKIGDSIVSIIPGIAITLKNILGDFITTLDQPMGITVEFGNVDTTRYRVGTISIYSSSDGVTWTKEDTLVDYTNKTATISVNHLTHFALMAERADIIAPTTTAELTSDKGEDNWYRSDVGIHLLPQDNEGGLGIEYTVYRIGSSEDWQKYTTPLSFSDQGHYKIDFYSVDKDENIEEVKSIEFNIDKTLPVITAELKTLDGQPYSPSSWTNKDVVISFSCTDALSGVSSVTNPITLASEGENQSVSGQCQDKAGNVATDEVTGINIDKTPPNILISANPLIIWPPNGKFVPVIINGLIDELHLASKSFTVNDEYGKLSPVVSNFGDTISLEARRNDDDFDGRHYIIKVKALDLAGNTSSAQAQIIVPHDQRN